MDDQGDTPKTISDIITQVTAAMARARVGLGMTNQYVHNPYEANINPMTPDGLKLYLKSIGAKDKDEDRIKMLQQNSKAVVTFTEDPSQKFGWSVITINIDDPKDPVHNMVNIFTSISSLKLENVNKQACRYWVPGDGNYCPYFLGISNIDPALQVNEHPLLFARFSLEMIEKGIQDHISKTSFQYLLLEKQHFQWNGANGDQKWDGLVMFWLTLKKINPTTQVGI